MLSATIGILLGRISYYIPLPVIPPSSARDSGRRSALFAIYRTARDRDDAVMQLGKKFGRVIPIETA